MRTGTRTLATARRLRREMTPPEVRLWVRLRVVEAGHPRFRRQHPVGPYVLDFYCPSAKLCVEVDGAVHGMGDQPARDERRDAWLGARGIETLRIAAAEVMADADEAADWIVRLAEERARPLRRLRRHLPRCAGEESDARRTSPLLREARGRGTMRSMVEGASARDHRRRGKGAIPAAVGSVMLAVVTRHRLPRVSTAADAAA